MRFSFRDMDEMALTITREKNTKIEIAANVHLMSAARDAIRTKMNGTRAACNNASMSRKDECKPEFG